MHPSGMSADWALEFLIEGNQRYVSGRTSHPHQGVDRRTEVVNGQNPFAVLLTCSDSRVPPEILFDRGIGDLFVVRTAGNVVDDVTIGSIEYAYEHLGVSLVLVLGHTKCGAVTAAVQGGNPGAHISSIVQKIEPAVEKARTMSTGDLIDNSIRLNVADVVSKLHDSEPILDRGVKEGHLKIVGACYNLDSGVVSAIK